MEKQAFDHYVRGALDNLYDPVHLQTHPLLNVLDMELKTGETAGEGLRRMLWEAMESLRPDASTSQDQPESLNHRLLWMYCAQSFDRNHVCQVLGLSRRSFYRHLAKATAAVSNILWERYARSKEARPSSSRSSHALFSSERACEEAVRVALHSPWQPVDLATTLDAARATVLPLAHQQGVDLIVERPEALPPTCGDPAMFHQIILNILTEGLELARGGTLRLVGRIVDQKMVWQVTGLNEWRAPQQDIMAASRIAVSRALLETYGGQLWLQRNAHRQLILCFAIPVGGHTVLIIDDDEDAIGLYRRYLQGYGYVIHATRQAEEMEEWLAKDQDTALPDLILLDVLMPQHDGWSLLRRIRAEPYTCDIPVLICSVLDEPRLALALGATAVLQKPFSQELLLQAVQQALRS